LTDTTKSGTSDRGNFTIVQSGRKFYFSDPRPEEIDITDIAHSLSRQFRFTGHTTVPWSVAQHSLALLYYAQVELNLTNCQLHTILLHDASEAYLSDVARPAKRMLQGYMELEDQVHEAISNKYELEFPHQAWLKEIDYRITADEVLEFCENKDIYGDWGFEVEPLGLSPYLKTLSAMTMEEIKERFLQEHENMERLRNV